MAEDPFLTKKLLNFQVFLLILIFFILTGETSLTRQIEIDKQYQKATTLKKLEQIVLEIQKIIDDEPFQPEWEWRLARSHYAIAKMSNDTHHYDLCIEHSSRSLKINPDSAISYFFRALCLGKQGEMQGLWSSLGVIDPFEEDMKKALKLDPSIQNGGPNRALGKLYLELPFFIGGSTDQAIYHLKEAVRLSPDHAENHLGLAQAFYAKNNLISARKSLSTLLSLTDNVSDDEDLIILRKKGQELLEKLTGDSQIYD